MTKKELIQKLRSSGLNHNMSVTDLLEKPKLITKLLKVAKSKDVVQTLQRINYYRLALALVDSCSTIEASKGVITPEDQKRIKALVHVALNSLIPLKLSDLFLKTKAIQNFLHARADDVYSTIKYPDTTKRSACKKLIKPNVIKKATSKDIKKLARAASKFKIDRKLLSNITKVAELLSKV